MPRRERRERREQAAHERTHFEAVETPKVGLDVDDHVDERRDEDLPG